MVATYENMVCTKKFAAKLTEFYQSEIDSVKLSGDLVIVTDKSGNRTPIAKNKFFGLFVEDRKNKAKDLRAIQTEDHPCVFEVSSGSGNGHYEVMLSRFGVSCNCRDHKNQLVVFADGCCKHSYKVLSDIGYESLKEYREAWNKPGATLEKIIRREKVAVAVAA